MKFKLTPKAKELLKLINNGEDLTDLAQEFQESFSSSDGFWYHITRGIGDDFVSDIVADKDQVKKVRDAIATLQAFEKLYYELAAEM